MTSPATDRPFRRQLLVNTLASGLANVWAMLAGLVSVPLMLNGLGRDAFGVWVLVMTFSATNGWLSLGDVGIVVATTREVSARLSLDDPAGARRTVSNALGLVVLLGLGGGALLATASVTFLPGRFDAPSSLASAFRFALVVMAGQVVLDLGINVIEGALEGIQRVDLSRALDSFRRLAFVAATATAASVTGELRWVAIASISATALSLLVGLGVLARRLPGFAVRPRWSEFGGLIRSGRTIALMRPLGVIQRTMDRLLVGLFLGPGAVALVEIATQLQAGADAVLSASSYSVMPTSSWLGARDDRESIKALAIRGTKYSMLVTLPVVILTGVLAPSFIDLWLGGRYGSAAGLTAVAVAAVALNSPFAVGSQLLVGLGEANVILRGAAGAIVTNLVVSTVLLQIVGVVGVFIGTLAGGVILAALVGPPMLRLGQTNAAEFTRSAVLPVVPPAIVQLAIALGLVALGMSSIMTLVVCGVVATIAYCGVALRTAISRDEIAEVLRR